MFLCSLRACHPCFHIYHSRNKWWWSQFATLGYPGTCCIQHHESRNINNNHWRSRKCLSQYSSPNWSNFVLHASSVVINPFVLTTQRRGGDALFRPARSTFGSNPGNRRRPVQLTLATVNIPVHICWPIDAVNICLFSIWNQPLLHHSRWSSGQRSFHLPFSKHRCLGFQLLPPANTNFRPQGVFLCDCPQQPHHSFNFLRAAPQAPALVIFRGSFDFDSHSWSSCIFDSGHCTHCSGLSAIGEEQ